jgi:hypothetical protein
MYATYKTQYFDQIGDIGFTIKYFPRLPTVMKFEYFDFVLSRTNYFLYMYYTSNEVSLQEFSIYI